MAVFIGLKISKRKSKAFPYGLYKVENLIALVSSLLIFFAGYEIITWAVKGRAVVREKSTAKDQNMSFGKLA